ncbi:MAG: decarboxylating NADP(+)-dependent phosphogluconate dehydrogenase [Simkaniaceae bacterium]|nr:decarboxylating NADP(+)-dependent phosphogluconate dehydrogenase [Simkaniaceae bacterium]
MSQEADIGLIGLAVMGQNLIMNMNDHGYRVVAYNRTVDKVDHFLNDLAKGSQVIGAHSLKEFFATLKRPRKVMFMVKAGQPVDMLIQECLPFLEKGDIIIDGGNSHFPDTERRYKDLKEKGILFVGCGVSGGEEGARHGPSLMPGGHPDAWAEIKPILQAIAAKSDDNEPCCDWVGEGGAGHYVKMVHNGIEYGDMQIICEAYHILKSILKQSADDLHAIFDQYNHGELDSYLIEITSKIFAYRDKEGKPLVESILDTAGQKGTGKWTAISALDMGMPLTLIGEAVFARCLSALKEERVEMAPKFAFDAPPFNGNKQDVIDHVKDALYASKIISYTQGFMLLREAATQMGWNLNYGGIALMWRGGCIIRSKFLGKIKEAYDKHENLNNLLFDDFFMSELKKSVPGWRKTVCLGIEHGIPTPCFGSSLAFFDGLRSSRLPANLLQAQRDFFGAHTYERIDQPRGKFFHTNWTGTGGDISSSTYNA